LLWFQAQVVGAAGAVPRLDGDTFVFGSDGFSADGIAVALSSPSPVAGIGHADWNYKFSWASFANYRISLAAGPRNSGFRQWNSTPLTEYQAVLWSVSQVSQFTDTSGSGQFADAIAGYDGTSVLSASR